MVCRILIVNSDIASGFLCRLEQRSHWIHKDIIVKDSGARTCVRTCCIIMI